MKKSNRALVGMLVLDALIAAGTAWFVMDIKQMCRSKMTTLSLSVK